MPLESQDRPRCYCSTIGFGGRALQGFLSRLRYIASETKLRKTIQYDLL